MCCVVKMTHFKIDSIESLLLLLLLLNYYYYYYLIIPYKPSEVYTLLHETYNSNNASNCVIALEWLRYCETRHGSGEKKPPEGGLCGVAGG